MESLMRMRDDEIESRSDLSEITVDSDETVDDQGGATSSDLGYSALDSMPKEWTNEKHSLYLKSMEASFVKELHCSMGLLKGQTQKYGLEKEPSEQFKTLRDGSWKNVGLYKYGNKLEAASESRSLLANPWIRHFRRTKAMISQEIDLNPIQEIEYKMKSSFRSDRNSKQLATTTSVFCRQDSVDSNTEMSGQNFDNNDDVMKSSSVRRAKRKKTETTSNADNDQVVPVKDFNTAVDPKEMR
ncbi:unnamed protein product [Rhodiola kirilowii]